MIQKIYEMSDNLIIDKTFNTNSIDSSADSAIKGLYLQKVRAVNRLLDALIEKESGIMCTIEYIDDVFSVDISKDNTETTAEQNKSYTKSFSINSHEVKNSIRIFFDTWREKTMTSEKIRFVFYTNTSIAKERNTEFIKENRIELPDSPIIDLLINKEYDKALSAFVLIFREYYISQHKKHLKKGEEEKLDIYINIFDNVTDEEWKTFLRLIEWKFNQEDEVELIESAKKKITNLCNEYDTNIRYVDSIYNEIISMIELGTFQKDFLNKVVHVAELKVLFLEKVRAVRSDEILDPMYKKWDEVNRSDIRNLKDKVLSVCPDYGEDLEYMQDDYIDGDFEQKNCVDLRAVKAYKYRIYKLCKRHIHKTISAEGFGELDKEKIDNLINYLIEECDQLITDKVKTYSTIPFKDRDMIRKTILILIEECYLAFDKGGVVNG